MVIVKDINGKDFYMDGYMKTNLDIAKSVIKKDWDMIFAVDGAEGSGKSVLAMQMAKYCDPNLELEQVVFTPKEFRKVVINAKKYSAIIYDEAYTGLNSRATMSMINRTLISMLAEIRQKNLFIFVVMPCFFDLDKYVTLWRSRALIHVYTGDNFQRGFFAFYNFDRKKQMYIYGKKFYNYSKPKPNFIGRFTNNYVINSDEYKLKKKNSLIEREKKQEEATIRKEVESALFDKVMEVGDDVTHQVKMKLLSLPASTYYFKLKQYRDMKEVI